MNQFSADPTSMFINIHAYEILLEQGTLSDGKCG